MNKDNQVTYKCHQKDEESNSRHTIFSAKRPYMLGENFIHLKHINRVNTEKGM